MCSGNYKVKNSRSSMTITVNMPKSGTASFYIKGLAEKGFYLLTPRYDHFTFYSSYSSFYLDSDNTYDHGWESWEYVTFSLGSGKQTLSFYYEKDDYASSGLGDNRDDRFCIDDLEINW